jgi:Na+-transporting NADH:ubiquinone oxidoreductase subunit C
MKQSNTYIFIYASVMVIIVAAILSYTAETLKPIQQKNIKIEKIQNILKSVGIESTTDNAQDLFDKYIPAENRIVINSKGEKINGNAFDINLKDENVKPEEKRHLPLFICNLDNGDKKIIIPIRGKGLWGPIWGYISFNSDNNTIYGTNFDHEGETPGLGAEIKTDNFQNQFKDKTIFEDGKFVSITVYKGGKGSAAAAGDTNHGVDAISGGTITSKGVEAMIRDCLVAYKEYFKKNKNN